MLHPDFATKSKNSHQKEQGISKVFLAFLYAENPWLDQGFRKAYSYESLKVSVKDSLDIMMKRSVNCT